MSDGMTDNRSQPERVLTTEEASALGEAVCERVKRSIINSEWANDLTVGDVNSIASEVRHIAFMAASGLTR